MTERLVASWEDAPYTSYDRRSAIVEHQVRLVVYDGGAVDVVHEVRSDDKRAKEPAEWTPKAVHEVRGGRVTKTGGRR